MIKQALRAMSLIRYIASSRATLAVEAVGNGTPVVFLHSNVCDRRMWRPQLDSVGATHKAIAYDRRGFGKTCAEREDFSARADLVAVLDATTNSVDFSGNWQQVFSAKWRSAGGRGCGKLLGGRPRTARPSR